MNYIKRISFLGIGLFLLMFASIQAGDVFVNPGFKLGAGLGKKRSFILGFEMSAGTYKPNHPLLGCIFGCQYDFTRKKPLSYIEAEIGTIFSGFAAGVENDGTKSAPRARFFLGYGGYASLKYSALTPLELAFIGKVPVLKTDID